MTGEQLKTEIMEAIKEAKRRNPDCQPVIRISDDDFAALEEYIEGWWTWMGDFMLTADGLKKLRGCPFEIEPTWIKGWAVAAEELR